MWHDFWFDEAWSFLLVRELVSSPVDILTRVHIDNNHPLNSFFLYALGDRSAWFLYRIPSLALGLGAVILSGRIMSRRGRAHAVIAMILTGCSYPLIVYSSEARGYAPMIFFALLAFDAHERYLVRREWFARAAFWVAVILGLLSHLTFVHAYGAMLLWAGYEARKRAGEPGALATVAGTHAVPLLFLVGFGLVYIRHLRVAGGQPAALLSVLAETLGVTLGTARRGVWPWVAGAVLVFVLCRGLYTVRRANPGLFVFFLSGILVVPAVTVLFELTRATFVEPRFFPRYFLVSITLCLLLGSRVLGEAWQKGTPRRLAVAVIIAVYAVGNLWHAAHFITQGRGHYRQALDYMAERTAGPRIRISSNSDFRTSVLLAFYRRYLPLEKSVLFYGRTSPRLAEADWHIREDVEPTASVPREIDDGSGDRFRLMERYPFYGLSGSQWSLYGRVGRSGAALSNGGRRIEVTACDPSW